MKECCRKLSWQGRMGDSASSVNDGEAVHAMELANSVAAEDAHAMELATNSCVIGDPDAGQAMDVAISREADDDDDDDDDDEYAMELAFFRTSVENMNVSTTGIDDSTCLRFLKARSMHVNKAAKMYVQYHAWRASFVLLGHISAEQVAAELITNKCYLQGYSKKGYPLMIALGAKHYPIKNNLDTFKRYVVHILDKTIASAPAGVDKIVVIVDLKHMGYKNVDVKGYTAAFQLLQNYYPERLAVLYMVNVPRFFHGVWKMIARFLDPVTREKIVFLEDHVMTEVLLAEVDAAILPSLYGGRANMVLLQDAYVPNWPGCVSAPIIKTD